MLENTQPYTFSFEGKEYSIPAIKTMPTAILRKTRNITDEVDKSFTILEMLLGEDSETLKALDKMSVAEFTEVISGWTNGVSLGESSGSES